MDERWTKPRPDGQPHDSEPCECNHCLHVFPRFDYLVIVAHYREHHRKFYQHKWDTERLQGYVSPEYHPLPQNGT